MPKYVANPVEVNAYRILSYDLNPLPEVGPVGTYALEIDRPDSEGGNSFIASPGMTARMIPSVGDYVVFQEDGYCYLNPADVFERKYRLLDGNPSPCCLQYYDERVAAVLA